jgi:hypothetical protein
MYLENLNFTVFEKSCGDFSEASVDGTLFVLEDKPSLDGEDYYSRKGRYGIAGLIVCDHNKRI